MKGVRLLTGAIMSTINVSWDDVLVVMPHKVINKILDKPTYSARHTWFKQICTDLIAVETPQYCGRGKSHLGMLQATAVLHAQIGDFYNPPPMYHQRIPTYLLVQIRPSANAYEPNTRYCMSTGPSMSTQVPSHSTLGPPRPTNGCLMHSRTPKRVSMGSPSATSMTTS